MLVTSSPAVSVICPVYKAEKYLHRCVDSILSQTFKDFELLLVDDGSPDRSGEICDEYAAKDSRVRVFHKENGGVSSARQCGIDNALGEYTIHADPDDWVEPDMLEELYRKAKDEDADMVICDFYGEKDGKCKYIRQQPSSLEPEIVFKDLLQGLHGSCCNKLVKRVCYSLYNIRFPEDITLCEDLFVNCSLTLFPIKVAYLPQAFYHYDQLVNKNSLTCNYSLDKVLSQVRFIKYFERKISERRWDAKILNLYKHSNRDWAYGANFSMQEIRKMWPEAYWDDLFQAFRYPKRYRFRIEVIFALWGYPKIGHTYNLFLDKSISVIKSIIGKY